MTGNGYRYILTHSPSLQAIAAKSKQILHARQKCNPTPVFDVTFDNLFNNVVNMLRVLFLQTLKEGHCAHVGGEVFATSRCNKSIYTTTNTKRNDVSGCEQC